MSDVQMKQENDKSENVTAEEISAAFEAATGQDAMDRCNALLIHACNCDDVQCHDPLFQVLCSHMKRFLRAVCWATHNKEWLSYPIANAVSEFFTYHALHCQALQCNVPLCRELHGQVTL
ncbi:histone acetyltransferase p300-like [Plasmopara halstedii]|uniref:Histone acetyltransferase p300-like n=1 Tax=Plasmopara halstedii TaxID=4781 RepID=A0A0P1ADP7_PLAHL|nr:histone acetyltransferase p300-like [Plasmopara halstedii]CEG38442.1 histone acetyltransferase p300-like [Plasmopara halstedii]|eukprot:XP_024574811.1 histone acetyltransferase p300-like [Plasmopara halstedii]